MLEAKLCKSLTDMKKQGKLYKGFFSEGVRSGQIHSNITSVGAHVRRHDPGVTTMAPNSN